MSDFLKNKILELIKVDGEETAAKRIGVFPSHIKRWLAGTHKISLEAASDYVEKVLLPELNESLTRNFEKQVQVAVQKAMESLGDDVVVEGQVMGGFLPKAQPVPAPQIDPVVPPPPPPAPVAVPVQQVETAPLVFKGTAKDVKVPEGKEAEHAQKFIAWMVEHRKDIPEKLLYQLSDLFFPIGGRNLAVLFPCYKYTNPATAYALVALALDLGKEKMRFNSEFGDGMIVHARNKLAKWFLASGAEWSLWMDDDMIPPIGRAPWFKWVGNMPGDYPDEVAGRHVVTRLMSHGKTIVGGCYFSRQYHGNAMYHEGKNDKNEDRIARRMPDKCKPTRWVGTGCLLVHRQVFIDIEKKYPELAPNMTVGRDYWDYFVTTPELPGEDVAFCHRAAQAGHEVHVDLGMQPLHVGYASYGGHNTQPKFD